MNKENINKNLWDIIHVHYEKECYTDCLKDACLYIIQLIQEKSEIEDLDGEKLITTVFSEQNPKLLINDNQTQTEKDEQRGFGFLLRGFICAIRNPISHNNNFKFTKDEADSILMFMSSYIIPRLDDSKDFSYVEDWFDFIFVSNENDSEKYSEILLENIPKKERLKLMFSIIADLDSIKENKYNYFINKLYNSLLKKEQKEVIILLNKKLIEVGDDKYLRMFFDHFSPETWNELDILVKSRVEEMILKSIDEGKAYNDLRTMKIKYSGTLGTWTGNWILQFSNKNDIIELLYKKLNIKEESEYVLNYFRKIVEDRYNLKKYSKTIINGLEKGKIGYKKLLDNIMFFDDGTDNLLLKFKEVYESFNEEVVLSDDDLPF